jgi:hypothetical protein
MSYKFPKAPTDKIIKDEHGNVYKFPKAPTGIKVFANKNVQKLMKELENDKKEREKDKRLDDNLRELRRKLEGPPVLHLFSFKTPIIINILHIFIINL